MTLLSDTAYHVVQTAYQVVQATLPLVGENIQENARRFYGHTFDVRPHQLPDRMLNRIAHMHVSLGLRPHPYPIEHEHLMWESVMCSATP